MAKELTNLNWIEELLPDGYLRKPMFGGFAYYFENRLVLVMFESPGDRSYKSKKFDFDLWNGCMFPVEREFHTSILEKFGFLINHPVLPKWFYLPVDTENFEHHLESLLKEIKRRSPKFGVIPKSKKPKAKTKTEKIDTRKPRMFMDEGNKKLK